VEAAFKAQFASKKKQGHAKYGGKDKKRVFKGRCFKCNKKGHMEKDCRSEQAATREEVLFMATDDHAIGWLLDSGASSHMTPFRSDYVLYRSLTNPLRVTIADGARLNAVGVG
jgi:hypothetical protein